MWQLFWLCLWPALGYKRVDIQGINAHLWQS